MMVVRFTFWLKFIFTLSHRTLCVLFVQRPILEHKTITKKNIFAYIFVALGLGKPLLLTFMKKLVSCGLWRQCLADGLGHCYHI